MPVPAPVTKATFCGAAIMSSCLRALSSLPAAGRNAVMSPARTGRHLLRIITMKRRELLALGLSAGAAFAVPSARAQTRFPDRPIRLVIPFAPGGVMDAGGRPWAD